MAWVGRRQISVWPNDFDRLKRCPFMRGWVLGDTHVHRHNLDWNLAFENTWETRPTLAQWHVRRTVQSVSFDPRKSALLCPFVPHFDISFLGHFSRFGLHVRLAVLIFRFSTSSQSGGNEIKCTFCAPLDKKNARLDILQRPRLANKNLYIQILWKQISILLYKMLNTHVKEKLSLQTRIYGARVMSTTLIPEDYRAP